MSWKSIVITGLLCVLASPVLAAPTAGAKLLGLDTAGNWVWQVNVTPDAALFANNPPNGTGGSVAIEVAATASQRNLVSAAANTTNFTANNPATVIPGFAFWGAADSGVKTNVATNQLVAGLGSTYFTTGGAKEALRIHTQGPTSTALSTTVTFSGAYTNNGRLAQAGQNFDTVTGANVGTVRPGNARLEPTVGASSFALLLASYETTPGAADKTWQKGDFNGDKHTNASDFAILLANFGGVDPYWTANGIGSVTLGTTPGAGGGSVAAAGVPEPTAAVLLMLGTLGAALWGRKR